jgi:protein-disulfide isomerase
MEYWNNKLKKIEKDSVFFHNPYSRSADRQALSQPCKIPFLGRGGEIMLRKSFFVTVCLTFLFLFFIPLASAQEDKIVEIAIETFKTQMRIPRGTEVKFIEKKEESPIPGFHSVKLSVLTPNREIPVIVYVDSAGEKVILGHIIIHGENVTRKEAGQPKPRKIDIGQLELEKSPFRGPANAKMMVVEFSNFQCPYCLRSWKKMKELLEKYPQEIRYVFKHFPLQPQGKSFELSEMVAATQEVGKEAFWIIHDFFFSGEGQALINRDTEELRQKIEEILKGKGYDVKDFQTALATGKGKRRVEEDLSLGSKLGVSGTPTLIINGDFVGSNLADKMVDYYLGK